MILRLQAVLFVIACWNWIYLPPPASGYSLAPESLRFGREAQLLSDLALG